MVGAIHQFDLVGPAGTAVTVRTFVSSGAVPPPAGAAPLDATGNVRGWWPYSTITATATAPYDIGPSVPPDGSVHWVREWQILDPASAEKIAFAWQGAALDPYGIHSGNPGMFGANLRYLVHLTNSTNNQITVFQQLRARNVGGPFGGAGQGILENTLSLPSDIDKIVYNTAHSAANFASKKVPPDGSPPPQGGWPITVLLAVGAGSWLPVAIDLLGSCPVP